MSEPERQLTEAEHSDLLPLRMLGAAMVRPVSLGCAECGDCCDPVKVPFDAWTRTVEQARQYAAEDVSQDHLGNWADYLFLASRCRPVGVSDGQVLLRCANYDREHRRCRDYENRPPLCQRFPWYGEEPHGGLVELHCSFLLDVPAGQRPEGARPLIPLAVLLASGPDASSPGDTLR